jgi:cardiolipin synthase
VLVDGIGALTHYSRMGRFLLKSGVQVEAFFPLRFPLGRVRVNLRNHRKILVIDGKVGFTGGMNISKHHLRLQSAPERVEDLHFRLTGPIVAQLQQAFVDDWQLSSGRELEGDAYFPSLSSAGEALCRGISSGPDETLDNIHWMLQAACAAAKERIYLATPYFVPSSSLITSISMAALRGVKVTLLLPSFVDHRFMRWVADAYLWEFLEHGVRIVRRPPPFVHTKLLVVDDRWTLLGSANLDPRSLRLNFEFNVEAYDVSLARNLADWLERLAAEGERVTLQSIDSRPAHHRLRDGIAKLFSPWL